ncbi:protein trichome birefringence-like 28 [Panicum miliaceum]|uniref:Protein trichome birefringence-like 28 n=1 Tax=Panicum miliaceum TaxID=4540 RepID=A0A3L6S7K9_PANMI|nr:protein trichome birefringence-like 28 [Panicum miliaceum]
MQQRRKSVFASAPFAMKQAALGAGVAARKNGAPLSLAAVVFALFVFATFLYNEDIKSITDFQFSSGAIRAKAPDLHLLQEAEAAAHAAVNTLAKRGEEVIVRVLEAPAAAGALARQAGANTAAAAKANAANTAKVNANAVDVVQEKERDVTLPTVTGGGGADEARRRADEEAAEKASSAKAAAATAALRTVVRVPETCDLYRGNWVYDEVNAPVYKEGECEFLTEQVTCMRNGRRDDSYQKWRWQPTDCDLPRFDARLLLERLRNKRLMFVGDSLNRNQWESMVCLVQSVIPKGKKTLTKFVNGGSSNVFRAHDYNATVEFYWAPFLVESNSDNPKVHSVPDRVIQWHAIAKHARNWIGVDYLVFNTYIWWLNTLDIKVLKGSFDQGSTEYVEVDRPVAYKEVLKTWAKWVDRNIDPNKTTVFFMGMSPNHITPEAWGNQGGIKCAMETLPITNRSASLDVGTDWRLYAGAQEVLPTLRRVPVHFVDITALSELRKDAHTSVHTLRQGKLLTPEQQADPKTYADCIHWCLPGLPDTWNQFLYARIASSPWPADAQQ